MQAVERLGYRVTVGDVASQAGLNVEIASAGLLALASDAGGHMQVAESGDIVYLFPRNFRDILRNKYLRLQLQEWWRKIWSILFYIIRISFGILLIASIALIYITILVIILSANSDRDSGDRGSDFGVGFFYFPDLFWYFSPNYDTYYQERQQERRQSNLNFLEAVFSFLFGDGNPNANLEKRRWRTIAAVIRNNKGAVVAEQIAPYLDDIGETYQQEYEDYMLPVLTRFNGKPEVSPEGQIVYYFPDLQVSAAKKRDRSISPYLEELRWRFSAASSGQILLSAGLGVVNIVGALILGSLLRDGTAAAVLGGLVAFAQGIYWLLLAYGIGFLGIPLVRYFWIQWRNRKITERNRTRQARARVLASADTQLQQKIAYAGQFAAEKIVGKEDLVYSTETDLLEQEVERSDQIDAEWQKRLEEGSRE
jgi:voltage-gated potassium channel Kch